MQCLHRGLEVITGDGLWLADVRDPHSKPDTEAIDNDEKEEAEDTSTSNLRTVLSL